MRDTTLPSEQQRQLSLHSLGAILSLPATAAALLLPPRCCLSSPIICAWAGGGGSHHARSGAGGGGKQQQITTTFYADVDVEADGDGVVANCLPVCFNESSE